jgi:hypothetical protein
MAPDAESWANAGQAGPAPGHGHGSQWAGMRESLGKSGAVSMDAARKIHDARFDVVIKH